MADDVCTVAQRAKKMLDEQEEELKTDEGVYADLLNSDYEHEVQWAAEMKPAIESRRKVVTTLKELLDSLDCGGK